MACDLKASIVYNSTGNPGSPALLTEDVDGAWALASCAGFRAFDAIEVDEEPYTPAVVLLEELSEFDELVVKAKAARLQLQEAEEAMLVLANQLVNPEPEPVEPRVTVAGCPCGKHGPHSR